MTIFAVNEILYIQGQSINADEGSFANYAIRFIKGNPDRIDPRTDNSKMPVIALNVLPRVIEQLLHPGLQKNDEGASDIMMGRYISILPALGTIVLVFIWGRLLYGAQAGLMAAFLCGFCPNILANTGFVSTDVYSVFMLLLSIFLFWRWTKTGERSVFVWMAVAVAVSQLVKQSLFHLYVLLPLLYVFWRFALPSANKHSLHWWQLLQFIVVQLVVINMGYYWHHSFKPLGDYAFMSDLFVDVQNTLPAKFPVPFPEPFITGLDQAKYFDQIGGGIPGVSSLAKVTIMGQAKTGAGFWFYYLVSLFFKTPIAFFIFLGWALVLRFRKMFWDQWVLLLPVIYFLFVYSLMYKTQAGIRHIVFLYPFIFIFSSAVVFGINGHVAKWVFAINLVYLLLSVWMYRNNYFPYTNEFILNKKMAYRYVGHANLEINQGFRFAETYMKQHPDVQFASEHPRPGKFLIHSSDYLDAWNSGNFLWISKFPPVKHVAYNWLLVEVPQ